MREGKRKGKGKGMGQKEEKEKRKIIIVERKSGDRSLLILFLYLD